jgi:hypothetical protein
VLTGTKRNEMLSVASRPVRFVSSRPTWGDGRYVEPLETVPPSRTLSMPRRLLTTILTRTLPDPTAKKRAFQFPMPKHIGGVVTELPADR